MTEPQRELDLGQEYERRGDLAAALAHYLAAAAASAEQPGTAAEALRRAAVMHHLQSEWDEALAVAERSAQVAEAAGLRDAYGAALNATAIVHQVRGDFEAARRTFEQVLGLGPGDIVRGVALSNLGAIAAQAGGWDSARRRFEQARRCFQRAQYAFGEAHVVNNYGRAALDHGNHRLAADLLHEAVAAATRHGEPGLRALATLNYAEAVSRLGDHAEASRIATDALETFVSMGNSWRQVEALRLLGDFAAAASDDAVAALRWREGLALAERVGTVPEAEVLRQRLAERPA